MARLRNENFFKAAAGDADGSAGKVRRAYQRCAETGTLNLSAQRLTGCLPETVCGFQDASWAENWWEQSPVLKLDISLNALEEIPSSIGNLAECESVLAYSNQLRAVPKELFALPLKQLNLKSNLLAALPRTPLPETLVELVLSENRLTELPEAWPETLEALELASNALQSLRLAGCERLKRLDLSGNALRRLPDLSRKPLRDLQASKNQLQQVSLEGCASLVLLDLSANQLQQLALPSMPSLDSLNVSGNQLKDLDLGPLPNLTVLMAESNKLRAFPAAVPSLVPRLSTLDLSNNDISQVPPELGLVKDLTRLALAGNPIRTIRPELLRGGAEALKKFLRSRLADADEGAAASAERGSGAFGADLTADLREAKATGQLLLPRRGLTELPKLPGKLKVLDVSGNAFGPQALERLGEVARLVLRDNALEGLEVAGLLSPVLQELDLSRCGLRSLGASFARSGGFVSAPALGFADFSGNDLGAAPAALAALLRAAPKLRELRLGNCRLTSLDAWEDSGHPLSTLDLEGNRLAAVPPWLPQVFPQLHSLVLANNELGALPVEMGFWPSLQVVSLAGNPLKAYRQSLLQRGWPQVAAYLRDKAPAPPKPPAPPAPAAVEAAGAYDAPPRAPPFPSGIEEARDDQLSKLRQGVAALEDEMAQPGLGRQRVSVLTHSLRMKRAELLKAEKAAERRREMEAQ